MASDESIAKSGGASRFSLAARCRSFRYAANGIVLMLRTQHNAWVHAVATVVVVIAGWRLGVSASDWRWLVFAIAMVLAAEGFNTAIESVCDLVSPDYHALVEKAKDVAAGAVLVCAIGAALIGALTFWPYVCR